MKPQEIGQHIQYAFDWIKAVIEPIENRWVILSSVVFVFLLLRAVGAHGVSDIIAMIYIMYWVTLRGPSKESDQ